MYRPLPKCLTIAKSSIDGLGLFAVEEIPAKTRLGHTHYDSVDHDRVRSPLGGFINHSEEPNCRLFVDLDWDDYLVYKVITITKVKKGKELLLEYGS